MSASDAAVVDTSVVSLFIKRPRDTRTALYEPHLTSRSLLILAAQTRAELELWSLERNWSSERIMELRHLLEHYLFAGVTEEIALIWAAVKDQSRRIGRPIDVADAWIAATALYYDVPLITHNQRDFQHISNLTIVTES